MQLFVQAPPLPRQHLQGCSSSSSSSTSNLISLSRGGVPNRGGDKRGGPAVCLLQNLSIYLEEMGSRGIRLKTKQ